MSIKPNTLLVTIIVAVLAPQTLAYPSLDDVCNNGGVLTVMYCHHVPYISPSKQHYPHVSGLFPDLLDKMVNNCCRKDVNLSYHEITDTKDFLAKVKDLRLNKSTLHYDLALPLRTNDYGKVSFGALYFIPITESFGIAVLKYNNVSTLKLMRSLFQAWPVLVFIVITAAIAGIVMWFVEKNGNSKQFSPSFSHGAFDGFWWAFISMTSVGYGDKYPKSIIGRILGSAWIVLGMLFVTMFVGTLTTTLMTLLMQGTYNIKNEKISVVHGSEAHWLSTSQRANVKVVHAQKDLYQPLIDYNVDAALVDINSVTYNVHNLQKDYNIRVSGVLLKETFYGIALRESSTTLTTCFKNFVEKHEDFIFEKLGEYSGTQKYELDPADDYFGSGGIFSISVYVMIALFFTLSIAGSLWEVYKWRKSNYHRKQHSIEDQETNLHDRRGELNGRVLAEASTTPDFICHCDPRDNIELARRVLNSRQSEV